MLGSSAASPQGTHYKTTLGRPILPGAIWVAQNTQIAVLALTLQREMGIRRASALHYLLARAFGDIGTTRTHQHSDY